MFKRRTRAKDSAGVSAQMAFLLAMPLVLGSTLVVVDVSKEATQDVRTTNDAASLAQRSQSLVDRLLTAPGQGWPGDADCALMDLNSEDTLFSEDTAADDLASFGLAVHPNCRTLQQSGLNMVAFNKIRELHLSSTKVTCVPINDDLPQTPKTDDPGRPVGVDTKGLAPGDSPGSAKYRQNLGGLAPRGYECSSQGADLEDWELSYDDVVEALGLEETKLNFQFRSTPLLPEAEELLQEGYYLPGYRAMLVAHYSEMYFGCNVVERNEECCFYDVEADPDNHCPVSTTHTEVEKTTCEYAPASALNRVPSGTAVNAASSVSSLLAPVRFVADSMVSTVQGIWNAFTGPIAGAGSNVANVNGPSTPNTASNSNGPAEGPGQSAAPDPTGIATPERPCGTKQFTRIDPYSHSEAEMVSRLLSDRSFSPTLATEGGGGDVLRDLDASLVRSELQERLTCGGDYNLLIIASEVDWSVFEDAQLQKAVLDWIECGGTFLAFPPSDESPIPTLWSLAFQVTFSKFEGTQILGVTASPPTHPYLNTPYEVPVDSWLPSMSLVDTSAVPVDVDLGLNRQILGASSPTRPVVHQTYLPNIGFLLENEPEGPLGDGRVAFVGWKLSAVDGDQKIECNAATLSAGCEGFKLMVNLLAAPLEALYVRFGPEPLEDEGLESSTRIALVEIPGTGSGGYLHEILVEVVTWWDGAAQRPDPIPPPTPQGGDEQPNCNRPAAVLCAPNVDSYE